MRMNRALIQLRHAIIIVLISVAGACQSVDIREAPELSTAPTIVELENLTYVGVNRTPVVLTTGKWQGQPFTAGGASRPSVGLVSDFRLHGDLNGDGVAEVVVLLWSNSGGSGTFDYIAVVGRDETGSPLNLATAALGDRVKIRSAAIEDGLVIIDTVQSGPDDAACCPGQKFQRMFVLSGHTLNEVSSEDQGRQSIKDLAGVEWVLTEFNRGEALPDGTEITLRFDGDRITGKSACNRYTGSVTEGETPGALTVNGPLAGTRMACPPPADEMERRYLNSLQSIIQFSFVTGNLELTWRKENQLGAMIFAPHKLPEPE